MPKVALTDAAVQRLKAPPGGRVDYFDASLPGFGVRVTGPKPPENDGHGKKQPPGEGRRSWFLFYRLHGKQTRLTIEPPYPVLGLAEARKRAHAALQKVAAGIDPAAEKAAAKVPVKAPDTFAIIVETFIKSGLEKKARATRYVAETRRLFDLHVLPRWRDRELASISRRDVTEVLEDIAENGTRRKTDEGAKHSAGGPVAANRVLSAVRALFNWAIRRGMLDANPCALVERPGVETRRERTLSPDEMRELWLAFEAMVYPFGRFFQIALLTGQRRTEVAEMRWPDIDLDERTWTLSAGQTKAGRAHVVPLPDAAIAILSALPRKTETLPNGASRPSPWVFTTSGNAPISGFSKAKEIVGRKVAAARKLADPATEPMPEWGIHDLRRTAATQMGRLGTPEFVIGKVLNHASAGITGQVYNRYEYLAEKRHALDAWARYLDALVNPPAANVVTLARAG